jgi:hypothetical protein
MLKSSSIEISLHFRPKWNKEVWCAPRPAPRHQFLNTNKNRSEPHIYADNGITQIRNSSHQRNQINLRKSAVQTGFFIRDQAVPARVGRGPHKTNANLPEESAARSQWRGHEGAGGGFPFVLVKLR